MKRFEMLCGSALKLWRVRIAHASFIAWSP
jgi:hypothetical protein